MKSHTTILCPIDFSEASFAALEAAVTMAERIAAEVLLVHVVPPVPVPAAEGVPAPFVVTDYQNALEKSAKQALRELAQRDIPEHVTARSVVVTGTDPAGEILILAGKENVSMIIMATHGESGWERRTGGSVTMMVIRTACCPVLAVPAPDESRGDSTTFMRDWGEETPGSEL
jgi:universal stress protein A